MTPATKSMSCRLLPDLAAQFALKAAERKTKPSVLMADLMTAWLEGQLVAVDPDSPSALSSPSMTASGPPQIVAPAPIDHADWLRVETLVCRAVWTVLVALSPTLDETSAQAVVNELIRPTETNWGVE